MFCFIVKVSKRICLGCGQGEQETYTKQGKTVLGKNVPKRMRLGKYNAIGLGTGLRLYHFAFL